MKYDHLLPTRDTIGQVPAPVTSNRQMAAWIVSGIGLVLAGLSLWYLIVAKAMTIQSTTALGPVAILLRMIEVLLLGGFSVVLVYGGYWLATSQFDTERVWWTGLWTLIGLAGIVAIVVLVQSFKLVQGQSISGPSLIQEMLLAAGGGALAGLLIGVSTLQSTVNAEAAAQQRDTLLFINELLRHNVLNGMNVILAYADQIDEAVEADSLDEARVSEDLDTIQTRGETIVELIENVRALMKSLSGELSRGEVALAEVLRREVEAARASYEAATFELDVPAGVTVCADELLSAVFENLLANAVEHNDAATPQVTVTADVDSAAEVVRVRVADNGPGLTGPVKDRCFEPGEQTTDSIGQGLGLYLVRTLVDQYEGDVWVEDNEPRGAVFVVELPLVDAPT